MASDGPSLQASGAAGRNLTYGLLDALGRAIVTGRYNETPVSRPRPSSPSSMPSAAR